MTKNEPDSLIVKVEAKHVRDGERVSLSGSPTSLAVCETLDAEKVYSKPRMAVHQDHRNKDRSEYYAVKGVSYNPYFGAVYPDGRASSVRKFVCKFQDKDRVGQFMQMIDHDQEVSHLLPFEFDLIEVFDEQ